VQPQRTALAWVRTAGALVTAGAFVVRGAPDTGTVGRVGAALVLLGGFAALALAGLRYRVVLRGQAGAARVDRVPAVLVAGVAVAMAVAGLGALLLLLT